MLVSGEPELYIHYGSRRSSKSGYFPDPDSRTGHNVKPADRTHCASAARRIAGVAVKAKPVAAMMRHPDLSRGPTALLVTFATGLRSLCAFTARHFGFGQSNQSHCSGLGPFGVPSLRRRSTGPRRWAVPGPAALARRPASLPGSATPPLGLHQRRNRRCLQWRCSQREKYRPCGSRSGGAPSPAVQATQNATCAGRAQALRRGKRAMDGELAPQGQGRPIGAAPGAAPERGNPKGRNQEQWFFPPFCRNKKGVAVKAKPVAVA